MEIAGLIPVFGNLFWTLAAFVVALSVIVAVHEYGHYRVGRLCGIHAEVFSLGFGPVLWSRMDRRGTRWQIAALPFGGYVKFLGDANAASAGADEATMSALSAAERRHTMHGAPLWARAATVAAGPIFNFILSILVFSAVLMTFGAKTDRVEVGQLYAMPGGSGGLQAGDVILAVDGTPVPDWKAFYDAGDKQTGTGPWHYRVSRGGQEVEVEGPPVEPSRADGIALKSAAINAGLKKGDVITAIDGQPIKLFSQMQAAVAKGQGAPMELAVWRDGSEQTLTLTPRPTDVPKAGGGFETAYKIGLQGDIFFMPATRTASLTEVIPAAARQVWDVITNSLSALWHMISQQISRCNMSGAIGIAQATGEVASQGLPDFIWFIAVLSTAVGFMNLFPIPMLDGGHLVFYTIEWALGRPLSPATVNIAMSVGLAIVVFVMAFGLTNDLTCP